MSKETATKDLGRRRVPKAVAEMLGLLALLALVGVALPANAQSIAESEAQLKACEKRLNEHATMMQDGQELERQYLLAKDRFETLDADYQKLHKDEEESTADYQKADDNYQVVYRALKEAEQREAALDKKCREGEAEACLELTNIRDHVLPPRRQSRKEGYDRAYRALKEMEAAARARVEFKEKYYDPAKAEFTQAEDAYALIVVMGYGPDGREEFEAILGECERLRVTLEKARAASREEEAKKKQKAKVCRSNEHRCGNWCCRRDVPCWNQPALTQAIEDGRCR